MPRSGEQIVKRSARDKEKCQGVENTGLREVPGKGEKCQGVESTVLGEVPVKGEKCQGVENTGLGEVPEKRRSVTVREWRTHG